MSNKQADREARIEALEAEVPAAAHTAFRRAYEAALATGHPVTVIRGTRILRITRTLMGETVEEVGTVPAPMPVQIGQQFHLR